MDPWHDRLAALLLGPHAAGAARTGSDALAYSPERMAALEIAFGKARSELTYLLELGRAHALPVVGSVLGDEIWVRIGEGTLKVTFDRTAPRIALSLLGRPPAHLEWDAAQRALVDDRGAKADDVAFVRGAIDTLARAFRGDAPAPRDSITDTITIQLDPPATRPPAATLPEDPKE